MEQAVCGACPGARSREVPGTTSSHPQGCRSRTPEPLVGPAEHKLAKSSGTSSPQRCWRGLGRVRLEPGTCLG
eukprot:3206202-Karenia_brevis.AAC.1